MVQFARLLTAAALVSLSVAAPMKARDNSYQQSGDNSQQGSDNSYQQGSDNSYQQGSDNSYQQGNSYGGDNSYQQGSSYGGDNSYQQSSDSSYQSTDSSYQQPTDSSYQQSTDSSYQQSTDSSYQQSTDSSYQQSTDSSYQQSTDNSYQSSYDNSYQTSSSYDNNYQTTTSSYDNSYQTSSSYDNNYQTTTTSSDYAYSTPSYGSGNQNWGSGYNDCVMQCAANYGMPSGMYYPPTQTASDSSMYGGETGSNGVTHTIIVAPTQGVYRYMPFSTNASVGDTVEFYWANGEHTVTSGSAVELCTQNSQGGLDSGKQEAGFQYSMVVQDQNPKWFYCAVADHCKQGMFGGININQANPDGGDYVPLSSVATNMTMGSSDMTAMWQYTKKQTGDNAYANGWGMSINVAGMDETTMGETMMNVMWTQTLIAANPNAVNKDKGFQVTNAQNLTIPGDISKLLAASPSPSASGAPSASNPAPPSGSPSASGSGVAAAATSPGAKNGAASVASSSVATVFVAVAACFFLL